jgi:hypothetical protein
LKNVPDIAPEIRGLLEEIVADPRSSIRLAPRRALSTWFDTGETVRATDVSRTKAERHLVEAHREELAALLCEASWISYWKAPVLSPRPERADGTLYHPTECELDWRGRAKREVDASPAPSTASELLRQCLDGVRPRQAWSLAQASLGLIPSDKTRCYLALSTQWSRPRTAIHLYSRFLDRVWPASLKPGILENLAALRCSLGLLGEARDLYRLSSALDASSPYSRSCTLALSCVLGDEGTAKEEASELGKHFNARDPRILEACTLFTEWRNSRSEMELRRSQAVFHHIADNIPEVARVVCLALSP